MLAESDEGVISTDGGGSLKDSGTFGFKEGLRDIEVSGGFVDERCKDGVGMVEEGGGGMMASCGSVRVGTSVFENDSGDGLDVLD